MALSRKLRLTHAVIEPFYLPSSPEYRGQEAMDTLREPYTWLLQHSKQLLQLVVFARFRLQLRIDLHIPGFSITKVGVRLFIVQGIMLARLFRTADLRDFGFLSADADSMDSALRKRVGDIYINTMRTLKMSENLRILPGERIWPVARRQSDVGLESRDSTLGPDYAVDESLFWVEQR